MEEKNRKSYRTESGVAPIRIDSLAQRASSYSGYYNAYNATQGLYSEKAAQSGILQFYAPNRHKQVI